MRKDRAVKELLQSYLLEAIGWYERYTGFACKVRRWSKTGITLISVLTVAPGVASASDAAQIVSTTCAACHGVEGKSIAPMFPNLAGQQGIYLKKQLKDFVEGRRVSGIMSPLVATLKPEDIDALAAYFSSQGFAPKNPVMLPPSVPITPQAVEERMIYYTGGSRDTGVPGCVGCHMTVAAHKSEDVAGFVAYFNPGTNVSKKDTVRNKKSAKSEIATNRSSTPEMPAPEKPDARLIEAGKTFYVDGNETTGVPGCIGCHLEGGTGSKSYPKLSGQSSTYIVQQLANFKSGVRANDTYGLMRAVVVRMSDQEIKAVAEYLAAAGQ